MRIAFLAPYSKRHFYQECGVSDLSVKGKNVWFFKHIPDRSIEADIIGCLASATYKKRVPLVMLQILSFLPSLRKYDVVISSGFLSGLLFSCVRKVAPFLRQPAHVILDTQAVTFLGRASAMRLRLARFLLSPVDGVICLSRSEQVFWETHLGFSGNVAFAPFSIDANAHSSSPSRGNYIFSCGATRRDWPTLISAIKQTDAKLVIVAGRDSATGKTGLDGIEIPENVELLFDIPHDQYNHLLLKSMFVVVPVRSVPFTAGLTVITQAMAVGKAVIATRNAPLLDYIRDGETGLFAGPGDVASLKEKITFLLRNPQEVERIGQNARRAMATELGEKAMGEKIWSLLQKVCANSESVGV